MDTIVEVMSVYDVVYVQEIDDEGAADDLLDALQDVGVGFCVLRLILGRILAPPTGEWK